MPWGAAAVAGVGLVSGMMQADATKSAAEKQAQAQRDAANQAAGSSSFRPVGITTRFGSSAFDQDSKGNITGAGYNLSPEMLAQQNALMGMSGQGLQQYQQAFGQSQQLGTAGQGLMGLGQGYLATSPQEQAQKYMTEQQGLIAPGRAQQLAQLQNQQFQQGRTGLAVGGGNGLMATNPEMAAYYNAIAQQDAALAANATQGGMQYAQFGAGLMGTGAGLMEQQYGLQNAAYSPYQTALGGVQTLEGLGQQAMDMGMNVGAKGQANASSQQLLQQGLNQAAATRAAADSQSPWAGLLAGASSKMQSYAPQIGQNLQSWWDTTPSNAQKSEVSGLGSSTWNPYSDYNTGANGWGNYGE